MDTPPLFDCARALSRAGFHLDVHPNLGTPLWIVYDHRGQLVATWLPDEHKAILQPYNRTMRIHTWDRLIDAVTFAAVNPD